MSNYLFTCHVDLFRIESFICIFLFMIRKVNLGEIARNSGGGILDAEDPKVEERMSDVLAQEVEALVSLLKRCLLQLNR